MERKLVTGGFYRHFKDKLYQVKGVAVHSETKEKMVVYQALYGDYGLYVRPYDMFLSEVDHYKYPDVQQKYRFELIDIKTGKSLEEPEKDLRADIQVSSSEKTTIQPVNIYKENKQENNDINNWGSSSIEQADEKEEEVEESKLIKFLDAYDYKQKLDILTSMRGELTDGLIDIMAESIEVAVPEGDINDRYNSLKKCLMAHTKYEGLRLRQ